ncbi:MAG: hypothetical protein GEV10_14015 [Streptosporangiales bacterium]|nr:hypothetical protein [Streptosporangiales bacterium]
MAQQGRHPNELLRRARGTRSQATLADLANAEIERRTGRPGALTDKAISELERGRYTWPARPTRDALCAVLGVSDPAELGFVSRRSAHAASLPPWAPPLIDDGRPADLPAIRAVSASLQAADRQLGGGHLYPSVVAYLRTEIAPQLAEPGGTDLFAAAASFSEIAGWMSHDGGLDERAERHFGQARRLARASEDRGVTGNVQASMSHLASHLARHDTAVQLADDGIRIADGARTHRLLLARLHAMRARGFAGRGDASQCRAALTAAERALDRGQNLAADGWVSHFDAASLASEITWCLHRLDDYPAAQRYAQAAIDLRPGDRVRSRTFAQLALARVLIAGREVDRAAMLGDTVRATAYALTSARVRTQLVDLASDLVPHRGNAAVARFLASMGNVPAGPTLIEESAT